MSYRKRAAHEGSLNEAAASWGEMLHLDRNPEMQERKVEVRSILSKVSRFLTYYLRSLNVLEANRKEGLLSILPTNIDIMPVWREPLYV